MFRSKRREIVYSQAEHARLAATISAYWGNGTFGDLPIPRESFVRGVLIHDRGYGEYDSSGIGEVDPDTWLKIQRRGIEDVSSDPISDLVALMHLHRLLSRSEGELAKRLLEEAAERRDEQLKLSGLTMDAALMADTVTEACDMISFRFCFEEPIEFRQRLRTESGDIEVTITVEHNHRVILSPWPLSVPVLRGSVLAYRSVDYPSVLQPELVPFEVAS